MRDFEIEFNKLINNSATRVPICLCLDVSGSMNETVNGVPKITALNEGLKEFLRVLSEDEIARDSAELCLIAVGGDKEKLICDFTTIDEIYGKIGELAATGRTPLGSAVKTGLRLLEDRKKMYHETDTDYYQPWLVIMSDGVPTDPEEVEDVLPLVKLMINNKKLYSLPIIIGSDAGGKEVLSKFSSTDRAYELNEIEMKAFFIWLSQSVSKLSQSGPGEPFDPTREIFRAPLK